MNTERNAPHGAGFAQRVISAFSLMSASRMIRRPDSPDRDGHPDRPRLGIAPTCARSVWPATYYRRRRPRALPARAQSPRAPSAGQQATVLDVLHELRFVDQAPAEVYATLLDKGHYHCSERTISPPAAQHEGRSGGATPTSPLHGPELLLSNPTARS
jgi:hypothetical protein